jgi:hypothetical protein
LDGQGGYSHCGSINNFSSVRLGQISSEKSDWEVPGIPLLDARKFSEASDLDLISTSSDDTDIIDPLLRRYYDTIGDF